MAAVLLALFLVTFLFDTRIGLFFLGAAIVVLYRGAPAKRMAILHGDEPVQRQPAWKDPWGAAPQDPAASEKHD